MALNLTLQTDEVVNCWDNETGKTIFRLYLISIGTKDRMFESDDVFAPCIISLSSGDGRPRTLFLNYMTGVQPFALDPSKTFSLFPKYLDSHRQKTDPDKVKLVLSGPPKYRFHRETIQTPNVS
jgi:hypothetical protein